MPAVTSLTNQSQQNQTLNKSGQPKRMPYVQDGQLLNVNPPNMNQQQAKPPTQQPNAQLQQGSNNVMAAAQNMAINKAQQPNQTMNMVEKQTQNLIQNPLGPNQNSEKFVNNQLSQFDRNRANAMQGFQQQYADVGNTGANLEKAYNFAMQGAQDRTDLEYGLRRQEGDRQREAMLQALNLGGQVAQQKSGLDTEGFNRLINARGAFEGERAQTSDQQFQAGQSELGRAQQLMMQSNDIEGQKALATLQGKIQQGLQLTEQDFQGVQASMDRQLQQALADKNIASQRNLLDSQLEVDKWKFSQGLKFEGEESAYSRAHELAMQNNDTVAAREALDKQLELDKWKVEKGFSFENEQNAYARAHDLALQNNDIVAAKDALSKQLELDRWKVESGQELTVEQNAMNRALELQLQGNDIYAQRDLMGLKAELDKDALLTSQDFEASQSALDRSLQEAVSRGDWENRIKIQELQQEFETIRDQKDREFEAQQTQVQRDWMSSERVDGQDFTKYMDRIDKEYQKAEANSDVERQKALMREKSIIDLKLQTNEMTHDEKMVKLDFDYQNALANNDVDRQETILQFKHTQNIDLIEKEQGAQAAQAAIEQEYNLALQNGDIQGQMAIQKAANEYRTTQAQEAYEHDFAMQEMQQAFEEKGMSWQSVYANLQNMEPEQAAAFVKAQAAENGVEVPDFKAKPPEEKLMEDVTSGMSKLKTGTPLSEAEYNAVMAKAPLLSTDKPPLNDVNKWVDGTGKKNHWALNDGVKAMVGSFVKHNGQIYKVAEAVDKDERHFKAYVTLKSVSDGSEVRIGG